MPWVRFDDQFPIHRKIAGMPDTVFRLHVNAVFWCARNLTDGVVYAEDLPDIVPRVNDPEACAAECVRRGAWHLAGEHCPSPKCPPPADVDGWRIHDYLQYQFSKAKVVREREAAAKRQAAWRAARNGKRNSVTAPVTNAASNSSSDGVSSSSPPRPETGGAGTGPAPGGTPGRASPHGPAGRTAAEAIAAAGIEPGHQTAPAETAHAAAALARQTFKRRTSP